MPEFTYILTSVLGEPIGPDLVEASKRVTRKQRDVLVEQLRAWGTAYDLPAGRSYELRPLLTPGMGAMNLDVGNPEIPFAAVDELKQFLLYSHSLALAEPITRHLAHPLATVRNFLPVAVTALVDMNPLLDAGIVHLVPFYRPRGGERSFLELFIPLVDDKRPPRSYYRSARKLIKRLDLADYPVERHAYSDTKGSSGTDSVGFRSMMFNQAVSHIIESATLLQHFGNRASPVLRYRHEKQVLELLANERFEAKWNDEQALREVLKLMNIHIPNIAQLSVKDIVNLRQNEEVFEEWRSLLSLALQAMPGAARSDAETMRSRQRTFAVRRRELQERNTLSQRKASMANGWRELSIGGISAAAAAYMFGGLSAATATGVTGLGLKIVLGMARSKKMPKADEAFLNHMLMISPPKEHPY